MLSKEDIARLPRALILDVSVALVLLVLGYIFESFVLPFLGVYPAEFYQRYIYVSFTTLLLVFLFGWLCYKYEIAMWFIGASAAMSAALVACSLPFGLFHLHEKYKFLIHCLLVATFSGSILSIVWRRLFGK